MTVNILGQDREIIRSEESEDENLEDIAGYADFSIRKIVIKKVHRAKGIVEPEKRGPKMKKWWIGSHFKGLKFTRRGRRQTHYDQR